MSYSAVPSDSLSDVMQHLHAQRQAASRPPPPARELQSTGCVLMIAPIYAAFNEDCAADNHCYAADHHEARAPNAVAAARLTDAAACTREFDSCVTALRSRAVKVWVYVPCDNIVTPDAHFPNNWISTYAPPPASSASPACIDIHSMRWLSRRLERRPDVILSLQKPCPPLEHPLYDALNDLTAGDTQPGGILEGTGSLVLDRIGKTAFVARSQRSDAAAAQAWASLHGYAARDCPQHFS
jgi:hypothetical protein